MPRLETGAFVDPEGKGHVETNWQISKDPLTFSGDNIVVDEITGTDLTSWMVPSTILEPNTQYFWRVSFFNDQCWSTFSEVFSFTTTDQVKEYVGGIDSQDLIATNEVKLGDDFVDADGEPVNTPTVKAFESKTDPSLQVGLIVENATAIINKCGSRDPMDFEDGDPDTNDVPNIESGLIEIELIVPNKGDIAQMTYHYTIPVPENFIFWKYDPNLGFYDYSEHVISISADRKSVTVEFQDGGYGDLIKESDGKIIDPAGAGEPIELAGNDDDGGSSSSSSCFISSVGSPGILVTTITLILSLLAITYTALLVRKK